MFKIESYITPLLMGYVDKYVKLRPEDFQLSLWGGDVVLNNLDLRLDTIERAIQLPIIFKSGYIHELRIHVPWTKLGSEPIVITINTIECILKLRDTAYDDTKSRASSELKRSRSAQFKQRQRKQDSEDLPPGYLQSLMNKALNNVSIIINNLIFKFVEDDIVLSINAKSAECYSVDAAWNRAFVELSPPELVLRKAINFSDLTVCLDKCDASGKIENYQDPLIYRCSVNGRMYMKYDSVHSKIPSITKFDVFCEKLDISFTDVQLPMYFRLVEMCVALYYGTMEFPSAPGSDFSQVSAEETEKEDEIPEDQTQEGAEGDGWMNWAWSYVPQILPSGEEESEQEEVSEKKKPPPAVLSVGMYAHKATITFKFTEKIREKVHYGPEKITFKPFMYVEGEGITFELLAKGLIFSDIQFGISNIHLQTVGQSVCGITDDCDERSKTILRGGSDLHNKVINYYSQSLFDIGCPANRGEPLNLIFDGNQHLQTYTEQAAIERYGVFYFDYLYTMQEPEDKVNQSTSRSSLSDPEDSVFLRENSLIRYIVGSCHYNVSSSAVHRIKKFLHFVYNHSYEPYAKTKEEVVDDNRPHPTEEQVAAMEECLPTKTSHLTILEPIITVYFAQHPQCDIKKKPYRAQSRTSKSAKETSNSSKHDTANLPCISLAASRFDLQTTSAMYPRKLVRLVSKIAGPSSNLLHHCHSHTQMKLFGATIGLLKMDQSGIRSRPVTMVPEFSGALYKRYLLLPMYWNNSHLSKAEQLYELPQASVNLSKANIMLLTQIVLSWQQKTPKPSVFAEDSLLVDIFGTGDKKSAHSIPMVEVILSGLEVRKCKTSAASSCTGTLSTIQAFLYDGLKQTATPLMSGPVDTTKLYSTEFFKQPTTYMEDKNDFLTFTYQFPMDQEVADVPCLFLLNIEGFVGAIDPSLVEWFSYSPVQKVKVQRKESQVFVDLDLAMAASPLQKDGSRASSGGSFTQKTGSIGHSVSHAENPSNIKSASQKKVSVQEDPSPDEKQEDVWGKKLAQIFPTVRAIHMQVNIKGMCLFLSQSPLAVTEPSTYIPQNFVSSLREGTCPETLVICLPHVHVHSSGMKPISAIQEIPIHSMEGSIKGEKLPWTMQLENFSLYTLHGQDRVFSLLKPVSVSCTIAVSSKYSPPTSNTLSSLGLCLHTDMRAVTLSCSKYQVSLCTALVNQGMTLLQRVTALYKLLFAGSKDQSSTPTTPTKANRGNTGNTPTKQPISSTSIIEDVLMTETETSGGHTSRETTPSQDLELEGYSKDRVRLSLWLQWTLPKFEVQFYKYDEPNLEETKVVLLLEDLTMSLDIQEVYAKVKVTCGSCNAHHYHRVHNKSDKVARCWKDGHFMGVLMNSRRHISNDIHILSNKHWNMEGHPTAQSSTTGTEESTSRDITHGFLNFTLTRAMCKNVAKRMRKLNADLASFQEIEGEGVTYDLYFHRYISELCLDIEPCDFILYIPAVQTILDSFEAIKSGPKRNHNILTPVTLATNPSPMRPPKLRKPLVPLLTSSDLPLLYVNLSNMRVFIPSIESKGTAKSESESKSRKSSQDSGCDSVTMDTEVPEHDLIVGLVHSITINSQAENPLPRYAVERDLYHKAMQLGLTQHPGSAIENRQYQIDIKGCALCSGSWDDFVEKSHSEKQQEIIVSKAQFPALEWNTILKPFEVNKEPIKLLPLMSNMNMRVVAAPAIVYTPKDCDSQNKVLVCGYSLEVNVTNKLDIYISSNQIHLIQKLVSQAVDTMVSTSVAKQPEISSQGPEDKGDRSTISVDSGIESDASTVMILQKTSSVSVPKTVTSLEQGQSSKDFTPFDVLLTANLITCVFYTRKSQAADVKIGSEADQEKPSKSSLSDTQGGTGQSSEKKLSSPRAFRNVPFVYLYFSQPHTVLSCQRDGQKFEMSCYDVMMKGSKHQDLAINENKVLPDWSDFGSFWIESRPGQPHVKTGIPPSLYTLQITDFLCHPACINLRLERPIKLNISLDKLQKINNFLTEIQPKKSKQKKRRDEPSSKETKQLRREQEQVLPAFVTKVNKVVIGTDQVVVSMETETDAKDCGMIGCVDGMRLGVELQHKDTVSTDEISINFYLKNALLKTMYQRKSRTLIGPNSFNLNADLNFFDDIEHPLEVPRATINLMAEYVNITLGQENVLCFLSLMQYLKESRLFNSKTPEEKKTKVKESETEVKKQKKMEEIEIVEKSRDDIRTGNFQYIMHPDDCMTIANPGEIIFCNQDENNDSSMTWCYRQPRVISHVKFTPIPFNLPLHQSFTEENRILVPCVLQYYDVSTRLFVDYVDFELSENCDTVLQMPELKPHNVKEIVVARMWRVLVQHSRLTGEGRSNSVGGDEEEEGDTDLQIIILPASLAASIRVDSCYIPCLIPTLQLYLAVNQMDIRMSNHFRSLGKAVPGKLQPFIFDDAEPDDQEFAVLTIQHPTILANYLIGRFAGTHFQVSCETSLQVAEYRCLTVQNVIKPFGMYGSISLTPSAQTTVIESNMTIEPMLVRFGKGVVHTLNCSAETWGQINHSSPPELDHIVMSQYVICNDTYSSLRFGQVGTEENLHLGSREMHCYSWRTHRNTQQLHLSLDGKVWKWCEPFSIDNEGTVVRVIKTLEHQYTLLVYIKQLSNVQKQVIVRGQLIIASRLSLDMELKLCTSVMGSEVTELNSDLLSEHATPSYVLEPGEIRCIKIRVNGASEKGWSKEIHVTGERLKENRMVKVAVSEDQFIHVWCRVICQHVKGGTHQTVGDKPSQSYNVTTQRLVLLCPLYVIRSHLPRSLVVHMETMKLKEHHQMEVPGQGRELQLKCLGADFTHSLSFQLSQGIEKSTSAVTLSAGLIDQVERSKLENVDVENLTTMWRKSTTDMWPYCFTQKNSIGEQDFVDKEPFQPGTLKGQSGGQNSNTLETMLSQPSLNLHINLSEYWPECSTLLIDVYPWCLMTNQSDIDLVVIEADGTTWQLPSGKTFTPPRFNDGFKLAVIYDGNLHKTSIIPLSEEEVDLQRYRPDRGRTLFLDGYVQTKMTMKRDGQQMVFFLTLQSAIKDKMRIITIRETFCVSNFCTPLSATLHCIPLSSGKMNIQQSQNSTVDIPSHTSCGAGHSDIHPLLYWSVMEDDSVTKLSDHDETCVNYMSLRFLDQQKSDQENDSQNRKEPIESSTESADNEKLKSDWSLPVRLLANENGARVTVAVPQSDSLLQTRPLCVTGFIKQGVIYYVIRHDRSPSCLLYNKTSVPIMYGHQNPSVMTTSVHVQEETELISDLPQLSPYGNSFYTPAMINEKFQDTVGDRKLPRLHFGIHLSSLPQSTSESLTTVLWSGPVDINSDMECFVPIPQCIDIKVKVQNIAMVTHVTIEPISKAEVSAKEVRSRIRGKDTAVTVTTVAEKSVSEQCLIENKMAQEVSISSNSLMTREVQVLPRTQFCMGVHFQHLRFVLQDETTSTDEVTEILQVTLDDLFLAHLPTSNKHSGDRDQHTCLSVCIGNLQVDNQQYFTRGLYDFPVLLIRQEFSSKSKGQFPEVQGLNVVEKLAVIKSFSFAHLQMVTEKDCLKNSVIKSLEIGIQPVAINLDDNFVFRILKEIEGLIPTKLSYSKRANPVVKLLPKSFKQSSAATCDPIRISHLCIHPMSLLFSVHASLKLFIASDRTPLSFGQFDKKDVCTTTHQLVRVLTMHYASGALFRAGIVVGSLEILGNPTGLVRSIGTGVADLIKMPYSGLTKGPGAFVSGVSSGMSSFVRNISSGMITSVTNFASSVSRNMDRLSLDNSHQERQEERRRQQPDGISSGLKQGLTGFGMSILGAVAGLADQPIQNILATQENSERPSKLSPATGIVKGVGKGIVGVFTKPIGGAAELVSQTGQGLLHGTGLADNLPGPRYEAENFLLSAASNAQVKYVMKYLQSLPSADLIMSFSADFIDLLDTEVKVELILTNELLVVMNCEDDTQQQAFSLTDLEISSKSGNPHVLTLVWKDSQQQQGSVENMDGNKDRVEAYIDGTLRFVQVTPPGSPPLLDSQSDSSSLSPMGRVAETPQYHFILDPLNRSTFVAQFHLLQNRLNGRGFVV